MSYLVVRSITAEGFGSYLKAQTVILGGRGAVAVVGDNGTGKSTIVSKALTWGLYGKTAPERMGSGTGMLRGKDVVNEEAKTATVTIVLDSPETGEAVTIERTRTRTKADRLTINGEQAEQADVDRLIGAGHDVFVRTVVRGQGDPWNFAEATDARKREILDVVSGAAALAAPYERAKKIAQSRGVVAATYAQQAQAAEQRAAAVDTAQLAQRRDTWAQEHATRLQEARGEVAALETAYEAAKAADAAQAAVAAQRKAIQDAWPELDMAPYEEAEMEAMAAKARAATSVAHAARSIREAAELVKSGQCPTCQQPIAEGSAMAVRAAGDTADLEKADREAQDKLNEARRVRGEALDWLKDATAKAQSALDKLVVRPEQGDAAFAVLRQAQRRVSEIENAVNPYDEALIQAKAQAQAYERDVAVLREMSAVADRERELAAAWQQVLAPKGVRAALAEGALGAIEAEANRWLSVLSAGKMTVAFPPTKEIKGESRNVIETIVTMDGHERSLLAFSGGEKRRINLAVDLGVAAAFTRGGALALSLLVLDEEVFSGMDEHGKAAVAAALASAGVHDVVVIDHDTRLSGVLARTVRTSRGADGYSVVEEL